MKQRKGCRMSCDVGKAAEGLENELWRRWSDARAGEWGPSVASPTSPGEPPVPLWWCLIYPWWFCNFEWLRPAGLYKRCKLALELKRLKTPGLKAMLLHSKRKIASEPGCQFTVLGVLWIKRANASSSVGGASASKSGDLCFKSRIRHKCFS